jgi:hypothetical protein
VKLRECIVNKNIGFALLGLLAVGTAIWLVVSMSSGPEGTSKAGTTAGGSDQGPGGTKAAPIVKRDELPGGKTDEATPDLKLPGALPALKGVQPSVVAQPAQPHGKLEIEGELAEEEAEKAIAAVFGPIRDCYAELRSRAPQAKGRMLMKFTVRAAGPGEAGTGELFLKETQFTDPAYLTCVRKSIDSAKFEVARGVNGSVTVPMFLNPADADAANAAKAPPAP